MYPSWNHPSFERCKSHRKHRKQCSDAVVKLYAVIRIINTDTLLAKRQVTAICAHVSVLPSC